MWFFSLSRIACILRPLPRQHCYCFRKFLYTEKSCENGLHAEGTDCSEMGENTFFLEHLSCNYNVNNRGNDNKNIFIIILIIMCIIFIIIIIIIINDYIQNEQKDERNTFQWHFTGVWRVACRPEPVAKEWWKPLRPGS